jgi:hypothetical protein
MNQHAPLDDDTQYVVGNDFYVAPLEQYKDYDRNYISVLFEDTYYPVYNKLLYVFLTSKFVKVDFVFSPNKERNMLHPKKVDSIDGRDFLKSYVEGFKAGEVDFDKFFPVSVFQGENAGHYVNDVHRKCFYGENKVFDGEGGWSISAQAIPHSVSHNLVKYYGFFGAKLSRYEQITDQYDELFMALLDNKYKNVNHEGTEEMQKRDLKFLRPAKQIKIAEKVKERLYNTLKELVDKSEHAALSGLIFDNVPPPKPISYGHPNNQQNTLVYIFTQLSNSVVLNGRPPLITGPNTVLAQWICNNFESTTYASVYDILCNKDLAVPKEGSPKMIKIKIDDL